jgi:hypothetical protein
MTATMHPCHPHDPHLTTVGVNMAQAGAELVGLAVMVGDALVRATTDVTTSWDGADKLIVTALVPTLDEFRLATDRLADHDLVPTFRPDFRSDHRAAIYSLQSLRLELIVAR